MAQDQAIDISSRHLVDVTRRRASCSPDDPFICESDQAPLSQAGAPPFAEGRRYLSTGAAAAVLGVSTSTMRRWIESGHIPALRIGQGKHWRVDARAIHEIVSNLKSID